MAAIRGKKVLIMLDNERNADEINLHDYHLHLQNSDYAGEITQDTNYVKIAGSNRMIDLSEAVTGYPTFLSRSVKLVMAGKTANSAVLRMLRNKYEGQVCRVRVDTEGYFRGRVHFADVKTEFGITYFTLNIPEADPYIYDFAETIIWVEHLNNTTTFETIPEGTMLTVPTFEAENITGTYTLIYDGDDVYAINLLNGINYDPRLKVNGNKPVKLTFRGQGNVAIKYRGGHL